MTHLDKVIEFGNGPYIIKLDNEGVQLYEIGWATLQIRGTFIIVVCTDETINKNNVRVFSHAMDNVIPKTYYEKIGIYFSRAFGGMHSYNFSALHVFQRCCKNYFMELDKELSNTNK